MVRLGVGCLVVCTGLLACTDERPAAVDVTQAAAAEGAVVYGVDDRIEVFEAPAAWSQIARQATVALMSPSDFTAGPQGPELVPAGSLQSQFDMCNDQRFLTQPTNAGCSGTLIDDDLVLTAGHCMTSSAQCNNTVVMFDYLYDGPDTFAPLELADLYLCTNLLVSTNFGNRDWAIFQIDRDATPTHVPAPVIDARGGLSVGTSVNMLGFPSGLPLKVDLGGAVRDPDPTGDLDFFFATTDSFGGNSGSGVFNDQQEVIGILTFGEQDYLFTDQGCRIVNVLSENGPEDGEGVMYAANAIDELCNDLGFPSDRLCGGAATCQSCGPGQPCGAAGEVCVLYPSGAGVCSPQCIDDLDCPVGASCDDANGVCRYDVTTTCQGNTVVEVDSCDIVVDTVDVCPGTCENGACVVSGEGDVCADAIPVGVDSDLIILLGNLNSANNDYAGFCGGNGRERVYTFTLDAPATLLAEASGFDTLIYLRQECEDANSELVCDDDNGPGTASEFTVDLAAGTYYLFMDAWGNNIQSGNYTLSLTFDSQQCPPPCPLGQRICSDVDSFQECVLDDEGCTVFGPPTTCPDGFCDNGNCVEDCVDECQPDAPVSCLVLEGVDVVGVCGQFDGDPCFEWNVLDVCQDNESCLDGSCVANGCADCVVGARRCNPQAPVTTPQVCSPDPDLGCEVWVNQPVCQEGSFCDQGLCASSCVNDCSAGDFYCTETGGVAQCELQPNGCFEYVPYPCEHGCAIGEGCIGPDGGTVCPPPECAAGESRCAGDNVETCLFDPDGCLMWEQFACGAQTTCQGGECVQQCEGECIAGDTRCTDSGQIEVCELGGLCTVWTAPMDCPAGGVCTNDQCVGDCTSVCTVGDTACVAAHAYRTCVDVGGCAVWGGARYCFGDDICSEGACAPAPPTLDAGPGASDFDGGFDKSRPTRVRVAPTGCSQDTPVLPAGALLGGILLLARRRRRRVS